MKQKIRLILFALVLCFCMTVPAFAAQTDGFANEYERVQDLAKLLSEREEAALTQKLDELSERQKMDVIVLTTKTLSGKSPRDYADDVYDYCNYGYGAKKSGLLLLISMEDNDWWISTCGDAIRTFTDAGISYIGKKLTPDLSDGKFADAFDKFADLCDDFITQAATGAPYDNGNLPKEPLSLVWIPISLILGIIMACARVKKMKEKLRTVRFQAAAGSYQKENSLNVTESQDLFLYHTVTRTAREKSKSSDSGGSSTHSSSSGTTHGGGGGKF